MAEHSSGGLAFQEVPQGPAEIRRVETFVRRRRWRALTRISVVGKHTGFLKNPRARQVLRTRLKAFPLKAASHRKHLGENSAGRGLHALSSQVPSSAGCLLPLTFHIFAWLLSALIPACPCSAERSLLHGWPSRYCLFGMHYRGIVGLAIIGANCLKLQNIEFWLFFFYLIRF